MMRNVGSFIETAKFFGTPGMKMPSALHNILMYRMIVSFMARPPVFALSEDERLLFLALLGFPMVTLGYAC